MKTFRKLGYKKTNDFTFGKQNFKYIIVYKDNKKLNFRAYSFQK